MTCKPSPISVVIPVHNGEASLVQVLDAIVAQASGRELEIIAVEDGGCDRSAEILARSARSHGVVVIGGPRRGAAAALNAGIRRATHPIVCQIDQDVIIHPGWIEALADALADERIAAAQGYYETPPDGSICARVMGLDLEMRYSAIRSHDVDHVCTGNTAYRRSALVGAGLFDESLGYGYDNDISYRLAAAGHRLVIRPEARSTHQWRDGLRSYLRQQYGFGYGRLDLVAKHPHRLTGDAISRFPMMLHAPMMLTALTLLAIAGSAAILGWHAVPLAVAAIGIIGLLGLERTIAGARAAVRFGDTAGLWFAPVHLARDVAWAAAIAVWSCRRWCGITPRPSHSMHPRPVAQLVERQGR